MAVGLSPGMWARACRDEVNTRLASRQNPQRRGLLIALIIIVALGGLFSGALTRTLMSYASAPHGVAQQPTATATSTSQPSPSPTAPQTPIIAPVLAHFSIKLIASPTSAPAGQTIQITARVTDNANGAPVAGLTCVLRSPTNNAPGLLTTWPTPTATNTSGVATWTAKIPTLQTGRYVIEVFAQTPSWSYVARTSVYVTAA